MNKAIILLVLLPIVFAAVEFPTLDLFFDQPQLSVLRGSEKKVFAHYFAPYPISLDNKDEASDWYTVNYLKPLGENGKFNKSGGLLRDRPIPRAKITGDYKLADVTTEIRMAVALGIDGFTFDILSINDPQSGLATLDRLLKAIPTVDPGFRILLVPDMMSGIFDATNAPTNFPAVIKKYFNSPYVYKLDDGRLVVSPYRAEKRPPSFYSSVFNDLKNNNNMPTAFIPMFLDYKTFDDYNSISYGASVWGERSPTAVVNNFKSFAPKVTGGKVFMAPVAPQDFRPKETSNSIREAQNSFTYRTAWECAMNSSSLWAQVITWSDYSEHSHIAPSKGTQNSFYDLTAYYTTWYKTGIKPVIKRDAIYYFHRNQPAVLDHTYPLQKDFTLVQGAPFRNNVEMLAFLTASATLKIVIGSVVHEKDYPAGMASFLVPVSTGTPVFSIIRNSKTVLTITSKFAILAKDKIYTSDFMYRGGGVTATTASSSTTGKASSTTGKASTTGSSSTSGGSTSVSSYSIGCYNTGKSVPDLLGASAENEDMTVGWCMRFCAHQKFEYIGITNTKCTCDNEYGTSGEASNQQDCSVSCAGDSSQKCGDSQGYRNNIYYSTYKGCFIDVPAPNRDMGNEPAWEGSSMTISKCRSSCKDRNLKYAGLQNGKQCFCSDTFGSKGEDSDGCTSKCAGNYSETCGAGYRLQVYTSIEL